MCIRDRYQRFDLNEACLFLRCKKENVKRLVEKNKINYIQVVKNKPEFFAYQLLEYLLAQTTENQVKIEAPKPLPDKIIRAKEVQAMTGLSRTTLWRLENEVAFPRRVGLGGNSVGWRLSEVQEWIANREVGVYH